MRPPAVEPAEPPTNISINSKDWQKAGQAVKSAVEKPVVEIIEKQEQLITKNNNDGTETVEVIKKTYEYVFYLPESLKQYNVSTTEVTSWWKV